MRTNIQARIIQNPFILVNEKKYFEILILSLRSMLVDFLSYPTPVIHVPTNIKHKHCKATKRLST